MRKNEHLIASLLEAIGFLGILYVIVYLIVSLCSCDKGTSFDWSKQPNQDTVPLVAGKFFDNQKTISIDSAIYNAIDDNSVIPNYIAPVCRADAEGVLNEAIPYFSKYINYTKIPYNNDSSDVVIKFYFAPWDEVRLSSSLHDGCILIMDDKAVSSVPAPRKTSNYNGLTIVKQSSKHYEHCTIFINIYPYEDFYQQQLRNKDSRIKTTWQESGKSFMKRILRHELGHTIGLQDDTTGIKPGLMVYKYMTLNLSQNETEVLDWLYSE